MIGDRVPVTGTDKLVHLNAEISLPELRRVRRQVLAVLVLQLADDATVP